MSDDNVVDEQLAKMEEQMAKDAALEHLQDDVAFKKAKLDHQKYTQQLSEQEQNNKDLEAAKNLDFGGMSESQIATLQTEFDEYIKAAKYKFTFLNKQFNEYVPFFRKNLILIAAHTGKGKSTAAANIAASLLKQNNPKTGKTGRCLIMTNEEKAEDFYARVICLLRGWSYVNHNELTEEQVTTIKEGMHALGKSGLLTVVDNNYGGVHGMTTTVEGIQSVFENMLAKKDYYDAVIIDYYQNIISSKNNISLDENHSQAKLAKLLDQYKNIYPGPIILMAQCDPETDHDHRMFKQRVNGRKIILDGTTFAAELAIDQDLRATQWTVWKSRYTRAIGKSLYTGFDNGRYVEYTEEFKKAVTEERDRAALSNLSKEMGQEAGSELKEAMEKKE